MSNLELVERAGSQGLEFLTWLVMRGAVSGPVDLVASTYYAPVSHTGGAVMLLDARGQARAKAA
jgi:protocatechuate 4,5-dioxygenase beta chain